MTGVKLLAAPGDGQRCAAVAFLVGNASDTTAITSTAAPARSRAVAAPRACKALLEALPLLYAKSTITPHMW